jgi:hypothetical protein
LPEDFGEYDEKIGIDFQPKSIQKIVKIGEVRSLEMNLYEVNHRSENDPRISLSRDSFRLLAHYGVKRALILFISQNSLNYRLSLVTIDLKWEEGKRVKREYSNPRRYSFFLGPETKTHTPETYLIKKGRVKDFDDLKERFSLEIVNKDFYTQIAILFTKLAGGERTIGRTQFDEKGSLYLPSTTDDKIKKEFSVRLIGRLVFCWFLKKKCSDKGTPLLPEELLSSKSVTQKPGFYHNILEALFFETLNSPIKQRKKEYQLPPWSEIPFLNGGLFANEYNDYYEIDQLGISKYINTLKVPDSWLKELFEIFEIYNFTIDENTSMDVELSIEPEMLGRIFENLLAEINPETGNTARKSTGSYYTPRSIVEYMVDESLKQYLLTKINLDEKKISSLLAYEEEEVDLNESEKNAVLDALDVIKIIDPACGSGAFPMGILQKMLLILQKIDPESKKWLTKKVSQIENTIVREEFQKKIEAENWNYVHKLGIIQNSIYGVDIQPIAVDISKLRFFLSLIVDEKVDDSKENRGIDSLPNLEFKFVCANSLIELPSTLVGSYKKELQPQPKLFEAVDNIAELKKLREEYLRCVGNEKKLIEKKFQEIQSEMFLNSLNWGGGDSQTVKLSQWNPFSGEPCEWFDPDWMFGIKDGFDVVIGNPPYVTYKGKQRVNISNEDVNKLISLYPNSAQYKVNSYALFTDKGVNLLKTKGILSYIIPGTILQNEYLKNIRKYLLSNYHITQIVCFENKVFKAITDSIILFVSNEFFKEAQIYFLRKDNLVFLSSDKKKIYSQSHWNSTDDGVINLKTSTQEDSILNKIEKTSKILTQFMEVYVGIVASGIKKFISDKKITEHYKKYLQGKNIGKYEINFSGIYVNFDIEKLYSNTDENVYLQNEKILVRKTGNILLAAYDDSQFYTDQSIYNLYSRKNNKLNLRYIIALLNSGLMNFYFNKKMITNPDVFPYIKGIHLKKLPLKNINKQYQDPFIKVVNKILAITKSDDYLTNHNKQTILKEYEKQIDQMVYKLYGLTDEEIKIVENFDSKK